MHNTQSEQPTFVLLHGFMGTVLAHFGKLIKQWYGTKKIVGIDLPGHGFCKQAAQVDYYAKAIDYAANKLAGLKNIHLLGVSYLGGTVALKLPSSMQENIRSIVVSGYIYDLPELAFCAWANNFSKTVDANPSLASEYEKLHGKQWPNTMEKVIKDINEHYMSKIRVTIEYLQQLNVPVLLLNGDFKDGEIRAANSFKQLNKLFSSKIIANAGHIVPHDQSSEFCNSVEAFWSTINERTEPY